MSDESKNTFRNLSAVLTGVAADDLVPGLDPKNVTGDIMTALRHAHGNRFDELIQAYTHLAQSDGTDRHAIGKHLMNGQCADVAENVIRAWLLGQYRTPDGGQVKVVSGAAYMNGLAWSIARAHPMGFSTGETGYWATAPQAPVPPAPSGSASADSQ